MPNISIVQSGVDIIIRGLVTGGKVLGPQVVAPYIKEKGNEVMKEYRNGLVKGHGYRTGKLKGSIKGNMTSQYTYKGGANVDYAIYVEGGTRRMEGQHQLEEAFNKVSAEMEEEVPNLYKKAVPF